MQRHVTQGEGLHVFAIFCEYLYPAVAGVSDIYTAGRAWFDCHILWIIKLVIAVAIGELVVGVVGPRGAKGPHERVILEYLNPVIARVYRVHL